MANEICSSYWLGEKDVLNLGEHFVELLAAAGGLGVCPAAKSEGRHKDVWMIIGSSLNRETLDRLLGKFERVVVWGAGNGCGIPMAANLTQEPYASRVVVRAVRGPLTVAHSRLPASTVQGDPGFLMPRFYPPKRAVPPGEGETLYVPHWSNRKDAEHKRQVLGCSAWMDVMMPRDAVGAAMQRLVDADFVLTNSLHCWIFCAAYGVPHAFALPDGEQWNMPLKWADVWQWLGQVNMPVPMSKLSEAREWWDGEGRWIQTPDLAPLLRCGPLVSA